MGISTALYFDATSLLYEMLPDDQTTCFKCADGAKQKWLGPALKAELGVVPGMEAPSPTPSDTSPPLRLHS